MAKKFYDIDEAATVLGVSTTQLNEMRTRNEIRGFRDGTTWKFRAEEVEKVAGELKSRPAAADDDDELKLADEPSDAEGGSVLLSERELGSAPTTSSTIIGKSSSPSSSDSDIQLADSSIEKETARAGSDVKLASGSGSGKVEGGSDLGLQFEELDSLELDFGTGSGKGSDVGAVKSSGQAGGPSDSTLQLGDDSPAPSGSEAKKGSDVGGSALDLSGDDDLVLGGSGSDVTSKPGDSGISLMDPSDSGLSLDEPLELGSKIDGGSLVLGEDDMITLGGSSADVSAATQLRSDDDFLLTPSTKPEDESESGSQVIALDSLEGFDEDAATQVGGPAMRLLAEDASEADTMVGGVGAMPAAMPGMAGAPGMMMAPVIPEAPYSIWNVLAMFVCIAVLCLVGMMMADLVRNMWSWDHGVYTVNSSIMDSIIDMFSK